MAKTSTVQTGKGAVRKVENKQPVAAPAATAETVTEKKAGPGMTRADFDFTTAVDAQGKPAVITDKDDEEFGLLIALPANYDHTKMKALKRTDFTKASEAAYFDYKAVVSEAWQETYRKSAENYRKQAETIRKFGNSDQRRIALKMDKMRKEYAELKAQMEAEGIVLEEELAAPQG